MAKILILTKSKVSHKKVNICLKFIFFIFWIFSQNIENIFIFSCELAKLKSFCKKIWIDIQQLDFTEIFLHNYELSILIVIPINRIKTFDISLDDIYALPRL